MIIGGCDTEQQVVVVAEIGNNHEGDVHLALRMIRAAAAAGVDAVKFQTITPERLVCADQSERLAQLCRFRLARGDHAVLAVEAAAHGLAFLSTPFDIEAVDWLDGLVPAFKVASGDNTFWPLLDRLARTGKPVIVSLGLGGVKHAAELVRYFKEAWQRHGKDAAQIALLHCVSSYPTPEDCACLGVLHQLAGLGVTLGYSDHTLGIKAAELAVAAGARIIEKHFTLDKAQSAFRDHQLSADPEEMRELVSAVRRAERMMGMKDYGHADAANSIVARRSIAAARDLPAGTKLTMADLTWLRPGSGMPPGEERQIHGRRLVKQVPAGHHILLEYLD